MVDQTQPDPLEAPVFIQGLHRSGTTLLYEMLAESGIWNAVWAWHVIRFDEIETGEIDFNESQRQLQKEFDELGLHSRGDPVQLQPKTMEEYGFILENRGFKFRIDEKNLDEFRDVCRVIQSTHENRRPLLLKNPWDFANGHNIKRWIPSAKFVYIHRDPVESLNSLWRFAKRVILERWAYLALLSKRYDRVTNSRLQWGALRTVVKRCPKRFMRVLIRYTAKQCNQYMETVNLIPESDRISITYRQLCESPSETIAQILDHLRLTGHKIDYEKMVSPRNVSIDPVVARQQPRIHRKLAEYMSTVGVAGQ